ncbi:hypothetical protein GSY69_05335 [Brevibacterium sp. 5221]|uniref:HNH endonuclease n=1 Tax=Brevibacterium rongguiense TaxID=2695267 RepID=A0A6N9H6M4_9MICO|nr:HNH endonuclease signature motif containing protein [Brevibacterium rongguiense]MYM19406.1 hypothetical protein [Brevibacterium rongguiense]
MTAQHAPQTPPALTAAEAVLDAAHLARAQAVCAQLTRAYLLERTPLGTGRGTDARASSDQLPAEFADLLAALPEAAWAALAAGADISLHRAHTLGTRSFAVLTVLPDLLALAAAAQLRYGRLEYAAGKGMQLGEPLRSRFDGLVCAVPAAWEWKRWKKAVDDIFATLLPTPDRESEAHRGRRVAYWNNGDGTACMQFTGPTVVVAAAYRRYTAWGRAILASQTGVLAEHTPELGAADRIAAEATLDQMRFDLGILSVPRLTLPVQRADGTTAAIAVTMPTSEAWLRSQAAVQVTLPLLTLVGASDLPGHLDDLTPVSAEDARRIAVHAPSMRRILTDPVTGTAVEAMARSYPVPAALRAAIRARWVWCTVPGCSRRAESSDIDHISPFQRAHPERGGLTQLWNLHPLCRRHHNLKTSGVFTVARDDQAGLATAPAGEAVATLGIPGVGGGVRWTFPAAVAGPVAPPGSHIEVEHACQIARLAPPPLAAPPADPSDPAGGADLPSPADPATGADPVADDPPPF